MIRLLKDKHLNRYKTIWTKDTLKLCELFMNEKMFKHYEFLETNWEFINNKKEIKEILDENFSSKNRTEEYQVGLPSATVISDSLFPVDLVGEIYKLSWLNNTSPEDIKAQEENNLISLEMGTYLHKCLELWLLCENKDKKIEDILFIMRADKELNDKIIDFPSKFIKYESVTYNTLSKIIKGDFLNYDIIGSEIFLNVGDIQGSVDLLVCRKGKYYIVDFKTTRKINKQNGKRKFSSSSDMSNYKNQLCLYTDMLIRSGYIPESQRSNVGYIIYQFHLLSEEYKKFEFTNKDINCRKNEIDLVMNWYKDCKK